MLYSWLSSERLSLTTPEIEQIEKLINRSDKLSDELERLAEKLNDKEK